MRRRGPQTAQRAQNYSIGQGHGLRLGSLLKRGEQQQPRLACELLMNFLNVNHRVIESFAKINVSFS